MLFVHRDEMECVRACEARSNDALELLGHWWWCIVERSGGVLSLAFPGTKNVPERNLLATIVCHVIGV